MEHRRAPRRRVLKDGTIEFDLLPKQDFQNAIQQDPLADWLGPMQEPVPKSRAVLASKASGRARRDTGAKLDIPSPIGIPDHIVLIMFIGEAPRAAWQLVLGLIQNLGQPISCLFQSMGMSHNLVLQKATDDDRRVEKTENGVLCLLFSVLVVHPDVAQWHFERSSRLVDVTGRQHRRGDTRCHREQVQRERQLASAVEC
jgi:hypothetical protein